jgi:integrase
VELLGKGRKWRTCPLWESTVRHVQQLIEERGLKPKQDGHLFVNRSGQPLSRSGIAEIIGRHARRAGATTPGLRGRKVTPHTIRHTTAMHLLASLDVEQPDRVPAAVAAVEQVRGRQRAAVGGEGPFAAVLVRVPELPPHGAGFDVPRVDPSARRPACARRG